MHKILKFIGDLYIENKKVLKKLTQMPTVRGQKSLLISEGIKNLLIWLYFTHNSCLTIEGIKKMRNF